MRVLDIGSGSGDVAVIGRFVLQFQRDASAILRRLATHVRPDGVIAFQESDWDGARSLPRSEIYDRCCRWVTETLHPDVLADRRLV